MTLGLLISCKNIPVNTYHRTIGVIVLEDYWDNYQVTIEQMKYWNILKKMLIADGYKVNTPNDLKWQKNFNRFNIVGEMTVFYVETVYLYEVER